MSSLSKVFFLLILVSMAGCFGLDTRSLGDKVALVEVKDIIIESDEVVKNLEIARKNKRVKAVVLRIDSPGGSVGASEEITSTVKALNKVKPVIVSMGDIAASGGYMIATAGSKIFASRGTITGSIGVRMEHVNAEGFFDFIRIIPQTLKAGKYKDIGAINRPMTPEEKKLLENLLNELHQQFKTVVAVNRGLEPEFVDSIATGLVYTGETAKKMGLIDEIGGYIDAVREAGKLAGIKGEPEVLKIEKKQSWLKEIFSEASASFFKEIGLKDKKNFLFEWKPL